MAGGTGDVVLYVVALVATIWVLVPAAAFALGFMRYRHTVHPEPARANDYAQPADLNASYGRVALVTVS